MNCSYLVLLTARALRSLPPHRKHPTMAGCLSYRPWSCRPRSPLHGHVQVMSVSALGAGTGSPQTRRRPKQRLHASAIAGKISHRPSLGLAHMGMLHATSSRYCEGSSQGLVAPRGTFPNSAAPLDAQTLQPLHRHKRHFATPFSTVPLVSRNRSLEFLHKIAEMRSLNLRV
jgi:hypothetical protein